MIEIGAFAAKNQFSKLLERAGRGEEIVITRRGKPLAKLVPARRDDGGPSIIAAFDRARARAGRIVIGPPVAADEIVDWVNAGRRV